MNSFDNVSHKVEWKLGIGCSWKEKQCSSCLQTCSSKPSNRQTDKEKKKQRDRIRERQTDRRAGRQKDKKTERQKDKLTKTMRFCDPGDIFHQIDIAKY